MEGYSAAKKSSATATPNAVSTSGASTSTTASTNASATSNGSNTTKSTNNITSSTSKSKPTSGTTPKSSSGKESGGKVSTAVTNKGQPIEKERAATTVATSTTAKVTASPTTASLISTATKTTGSVGNSSNSSNSTKPSNSRKRPAPSSSNNNTVATSSNVVSSDTRKATSKPDKQDRSLPTTASAKKPRKAISSTSANTRDNSNKTPDSRGKGITLGDPVSKDKSTPNKTKTPTSASSKSGKARDGPEKMDVDGATGDKAITAKGSGTPSSTSASSDTKAKATEIAEHEEEEASVAEENSQSTSTAISFEVELAEKDANGENRPVQVLLKRPGTSTPLRVKVGDDVFVFQPDPEEEQWPPARINSFRMVQDDIVFGARWFVSKEDLESFLSCETGWEGEASREALIHSLEHPDGVALSNNIDENSIGTISKKATVLHADQRPTSSSSSPTKDPTYFCRYEVENVGTGRVKISSFDVNNRVPYVAEDTDPDVAVEEEQGSAEVEDAKTLADLSDKNASLEKKERPDKETKDGGKDETSHDDSDNENDASVGGQKAMIEGEGSTLREAILVGPHHQAKVGKFVPNEKKVVSRNPKRVWQPGLVSDDALANYLSKVAEIHTPYLEEQNLTSTDAYTPVLDLAKLEKLLSKRPERFTGSSLSTSSMLAGEEMRASLRKECDPDLLLEILADKGGDVDSAIKAISNNLAPITTSWTPDERDKYRDGFRKHQAALRKIAKKLVPAKSMKDIVDFHFRFQIPDQFRLYQNKKREIAVRMVESMERRRAHSSQKTAVEGVQENGPRQKGDALPFYETSVNDLESSLEERRRQAYSLMVEMKATVGDEMMEEVGQLIKQLNESFSIHSQTMLLECLEGHDDLKQRLMEFLPSA